MILYNIAKVQSHRGRGGGGRGGCFERLVRTWLHFLSLTRAQDQRVFFFLSFYNLARWRWMNFVCALSWTSELLQLRNPPPPLALFLSCLPRYVIGCVPLGHPLIKTLHHSSRRILLPPTFLVRQSSLPGKSWGLFVLFVFFSLLLFLPSVYHLVLDVFVDVDTLNLRHGIKTRHQAGVATQDEFFCSSTWSE